MELPESVDPNPDLDPSRMTLGEHLDELRTRLVRSAIAFTVVFIAAWTYQNDVVEAALAPFEQKARPWLNEDLFEINKVRLDELALKRGETEPNLEERKLYFYDGEVEISKMKEPILTMRVNSGTSNFFFYLQACGYASMFVAGPYVLLQIWGFIAAGLYSKEKRVVYRYFPASVALFFGGAAFGYFYLVPYAYYFISKMGLEQLRHSAEVREYFAFLSSLALGMGVVFQLPVAMMGFARVGLVSPASYAKYRGHFVVAAFVIAAVITPPDPYTQAMMAAPMAILYEVGIWLAKLVAKREPDDETGIQPS
jgi:sec-independent protein translocase protein TatC